MTTLDGIYKILEKFFSSTSNSKSIEGLGVMLYKEVLKMMEMWHAFNDGGPTEHWLEEFSGKMYEIGEFRKYPQGIYAPLDPQAKSSKITKIKNNFKFKNADTLISHLRNVILNETDDDGNKKYYDQIMKVQKGFKVSPEDFSFFIKYLALSLTGQYPGPFDWSDYNEIYMETVDYDKPVNINKTRINDVFKTLFVNFLGPNRVLHR